MEKEVLLHVEGLKKYFPVVQGKLLGREIKQLRAVDDISFDVYQGETLGLVGESGCGKSTTGRTILQLYRPTAGKVAYAGTDLVHASKSEVRKLRQKMQMIFQDPYASLNPRMTVSETIGDPIRIHGLLPRNEVEGRVKELLEMVGLNPAFTNRYPHEFSGGQRQRIGIARALALDPDLIVCDEPISALDVSIQAQVVNLLEDLQDKLGLTYLFIAHDLSMVRHISTRVAVMYLGVIVELADRTELYENPLHPYTQRCFPLCRSRILKLRRNVKRIILTGDVPSPINPPSGCRFRTRCPLAGDICARERPEFLEAAPGHWVACHFAV